MRIKKVMRINFHRTHIVFCIKIGCLKFRYVNFPKTKKYIVQPSALHKEFMSLYINSGLRYSSLTIIISIFNCLIIILIYGMLIAYFIKMSIFLSVFCVVASLFRGYVT